MQNILKPCREYNYIQSGKCKIYQVVDKWKHCKCKQPLCGSGSMGKLTALNRNYVGLTG